jgi:glucose-6-phosphate isomerase
VLSLDYTLTTSPAVEGGITDAELQQCAVEFRAAHAATQARHARGELGFLDLPRDKALLTASKKLAQEARGRGITDVIVLGIGGSALGPIALRTALLPSGWNSLSESARGGFPRLHVLDNIDPSTMAALLERVDLRTTLVVAISKSGGTAETMAQYLIMRERLDKASLDPRDHLILVTDPARGALRAVAEEERIPAVEIPPNVGGRFSVFSPVGLLPAALVGIDVDQLLTGAGEILKRSASEVLAANPAGLFATLHWFLDTRRARRIHVFMPYTDHLRDVSGWFVQLWAESLGKVRPDGSHLGPTPLPAVGATDQHSQVQLFMEGPQDKVITFVTLATGGVDLTIPRAARPLPELEYLEGHRMGELLDVERRATAGALAVRGRPNMTIILGAGDAWHVGALLMLLQIATAYAGELYGVNAFDQPGVELGKRFTYAILGRAGFDDARSEWEALPRSDPRYIV